MRTVQSIKQNRKDIQKQADTARGSRKSNRPGELKRLQYVVRDTHYIGEKLYCAGARYSAGEVACTIQYPHYIGITTSCTLFFCMCNVVSGSALPIFKPYITRISGDARAFGNTAVRFLADPARRSRELYQYRLLVSYIYTIQYTVGHFAAALYGERSLLN